MGFYLGKRGTVKIGATPDEVLEIVSFTITETVPVEEGTATRAAAKRFKPGIPTWTGELTVQFEPGDATGQEALTIGAQLDAQFYPVDDQTGDAELSGSIIITEIGIEHERDSVVTRSYSFQGDDALVHGTVGP